MTRYKPEMSEKGGPMMKGMQEEEKSGDYGDEIEGKK